MDMIILVIFALPLLILMLWPFTWMGFRDKSLPPGPPTLPFIGNLHMIPKTGLYLKYTEWARSYGSTFSLKVGQGTMVVLNSAIDAGRLMDKRSLHSSNRPPSYAVGHLVFGGNSVLFMNADAPWKLVRKLFHQLLREAVCDKEHLPLLEAESSQLVRDICLDPGALMLHPGRFSNSITTSIVFGIRTPKHDTPHYLKFRKYLTELNALGEIGATPPVDLLPVLKYLPERLWGNWKRRARLLRETVSDIYPPLVDRVIERRTMGSKLNSFLDGVLDQQDKLRLRRDQIELMCGNLLEGGTDTIATIILTLCQAMALHPRMQQEVHAHIDSVTVDSKMPSFTDYERLPYIAMVIKELQRWRPPGPAGIPHAQDEDDELDGMKIPKGSAIILNTWGIHNDANRYADPEVFNPYRYQNQTQLASVYANSSDYQNRDHFGYGIGRRICPGIHLAERSLFLAVARILWAFTIQPKLDQTGNPIPIDVDPATGYHEGLLNECLPFEVDIKIRSEKRLETILAEVAKAEAGIFSAFS